MRGATMIEFALVLPLLLLMAFGTAEMGLAWVSNNRVEGSISTAARIASSSGSLPEADANVLKSLKSSLPQEQLNRLDRVVIFKPTNVTGGVPAGCISPSVTRVNSANSSCNSYTGATVRGTIPTSWARPMTSGCPPTRNDRLATRPTTSGCGSAPRTVPRPAPSSTT